MTEQEKLDIIADPDNAEAIFSFVGKDEIFSDYCKKCISEDLSLSEYVYKYKSADFIKYLNNKGWLKNG